MDPRQLLQRLLQLKQESEAIMQQLASAGVPQEAVMAALPGGGGGPPMPQPGMGAGRGPDLPPGMPQGGPPQGMPRGLLGGMR